MEYTQEEKKAISDFKKNETILNLIEKQQKEIEKYKRIAEMNLKDGEEFKNEMCEHRCILKSELEENYISKELIREKLKFYENLPNIGIFQGREAIIRVLKELLGE